MRYKAILEQTVSAQTFNLANCLNIEHNCSDTVLVDGLARMQEKLRSADYYKTFKSALIRTCFLIELTDTGADTDSTKYRVRWTDLLSDDPRFCSYNDCLTIFKNLLAAINNMNEDSLTLLKDYSKNFVYGNNCLPIDYIDRAARPIHTPANINIFLDAEIVRYIKVKNIITNRTLNPKSSIFTKVISSKIKVKAYQTDRAQTGTHKTNREKRWESHPDNFQFALKRDCSAIEASLILQVCQFEGANQILVQNLIRAELIPQQASIYKCPVTGNNLKYNDFEQEILNRTHGKSLFQVGHLTPLKAGGLHIPNNIGWISDDGNRIQGSLSLEEVDRLLKTIYMNRPELRG